MKTTIPIILIVMAFLVACDTIEQDDFLQSGNSGGIDSTTIIKKVLIEDFTGFRCKNCPEAATELHAIEGLYEGKIVGIGIHVGYFATPAGSFSTDFRTDAGEELDAFFSASLSGLPIGLVNRIGFPNALSQHTDWASMVPDIINQEATVAISITDNGSNQITVQAKELSNVSGNLKLVVCITEDGIIDNQIVGNDVVENYEHNHVLRTHLNGTWGTNVSLSSEYTSYDFSYDLDASWQRNNCNAIAYIYNDSNKEVLQVEKIHLTN
ncbi:MAG: Omp28 family outer membrane lipoprotein [Bacteroidota bacterium]|nr:Omp28 family outer membrane lipoprotein [Bacteroidota bacterium]